MGLGNVGIMAMQLYTALGYEVYGMDIDAGHAAFVSERFGLRAYSSFGTEYGKRFGLALECSGTQQGTLECCRLLDKEGELSFVGVPWRQTASAPSIMIDWQTGHKPKAAFENSFIPSILFQNRNRN